MEIAVVVPSFGRPRSLRVCLDALAAQRREPDDVVVVTRHEDSPTRELVRGYDAVREQVVDVPGQIAALTAGCLAARGDVVAITDDDAAPWPDWVERLERWFAVEEVVGVGGRDRIASVDGEPRTEDVGRLRWYGRLSGNHHLGTGPAREVDVLKGVNMAFRREALREPGFDPRLRGAGAQVHNDMMLSLSVRRSGARLLYDPELVVDHMPAERPAGDARTTATSQQQVDAVHNETLAILEYLPAARRLVFLLWATVIGRNVGPGLVHTLLRARPDECRARRWRRLRDSLAGRRLGWRTFRQRPWDR